MSSPTLEDFSRRVTKPLILVISAAALLAIIIVVYDFRAKTEVEKRNTDTELQDALELLTSELYGQVGILVSASEFIDYMRSDLIHRRKGEQAVRNLLSRISWSGISGITIHDQIGRFLFTTQKQTNLNLINIPICYLGDTFDIEFGDCVGSINIYLSNKIIIDRLQQINPKIKICSFCEPVKELPIFTSYIESSSSDLNLPVEIPIEPNYTVLGLNIGAIIVICGSILFVLYTQLSIAIRYYIWLPLKGAGEIEWRQSIKEIQETHYRKRLLSDLTKETAVRERQLADNIHDIFLSDLATLKMLVRECNGSPAANQRVIGVIDEAIKKARNIIDALRPETLDTLGFEKSLKILFDSMPIAVDRHFSDGLVSIPSGIDLQVFLIIKEALTNVIKHADVDRAEVIVNIEDKGENNKLFIEIKDNGKGFDSKNYTAGVGLESIKSRALSLGSLDINSKVGVGTSIQVSINFGKSI